MTADTTNLWLYEEDDAIIVGENRKYPWKLHGMFGASATSYGAIGENYILASGLGAKWQAGRGLIRVKVALFATFTYRSEYRCANHSGLFGYRDEDGNFSMGKFMEKVKESNIRAFELKFGQGAKIRGGHLEGQK